MRTELRHTQALIEKGEALLARSEDAVRLLEMMGDSRAKEMRAKQDALRTRLASLREDVRILTLGGTK